MLSIRCDKCKKGELVIDEMSTSNMYLQDTGNYSVNIDTGVLEESSIQDYLIYRCNVCDNKHSFTYKEWELKYRMEIANRIMEIRKREAFKKLNPDTVNIDSGLEFCGKCSGYAEDGYCLVDIIKQCSIRNI